MNHKDEDFLQIQNDFVNAQTYHWQLMSEIQTLFQIYCALCGEHAKVYEHALARSIFFVLFGSIESTCRLFAASTLLADARREREGIAEGSPIIPLTETEKQFLRQETEEVSTKDWTPKQRTKYIPFEDALVGYPTLYARIFGITLKIDKSCLQWQDLIKLKRLRDIGAHGNTRNLSESPGSMTITYSDIKRLLECRRWYCEELKPLPWIAKIEVEEQTIFIEALLEAGFSERCRLTRAKRFALQKKKDKSGRNCHKKKNKTNYRTTLIRPPLVKREKYPLDGERDF